MHRHYHCFKCGMHIHFAGMCSNCIHQAVQASNSNRSDRSGSFQSERFSSLVSSSDKKPLLSKQSSNSTLEPNASMTLQSNSNTNLIEVARLSQEIEKRTKQEAEKERQKENKNSPQMLIRQNLVSAINQDLAAYKALEKFSDAEIDGIYKKIFKLTNDFINTCNNHHHIINNFWHILGQGEGVQVNQRKRLVEFAKALFDPKNKHRIEQHVSGKFSRYFLNVISFLLLCVPALIRAVDSYKTYGTCRFWLAPGEKLSVYFKEQAELKEFTNTTQSFYNFRSSS